MQRSCYLFCFLIIYSFLSCKSVQRYEAPYQPNEIVVVGLGMNFNDYDENRRIWSEDWRKAMGEQRHVQVLEERIKKGKNIEENTNELQQYTDYLYKQQEARIIERMDFLREFYHDIFTLDKVVFIKKYKAHCSRDLLKRLKNINKKIHSKKTDGYAWVAFTDNKIHQSEEFTFTHIDYRFDMLDKVCFHRMYDNIKQFFALNDFQSPFYNWEDKWYKVRMGDSDVMVKVEGLGKRIAITGVINPAMNVWINTWYDR